jgi:peptide deformylase
VATQEEKRASESAARRRLALQQVRQFPDPVLKQRSREVEAFDDDLAALAARMIDLMTDAHGAGLAAPQIGLLRRMFVYEVSEDEGPVVVVNPEIVEVSEEVVVDGEGCLSLSLLIDERHDVPVERHASVKLRSFDVEGNEVVRDLEGHAARVVQHEIDHLDGTLILDRTTREARGDALRLLRRALT